ncbi:hypothetical protein EDC01DRAFT_763323 [Geopyxis carbonaria]|nr:hypothetical protein EDC01DRAFT_763323 [Geopyxis carbonaria]
MIAPNPDFLGGRPRPFALRTLPGKGVSVLATLPISADTLLLAAAPLLILHTSSGPKPAEILHHFAALPAATQAAYLDLCSGLEAEKEQDQDARVLGVWQCNNFCLDDQGCVNAVFDLPSRLNHACVGRDNCRWQWDEEKGVIRFWAERDVEVGEELTHCYRPDWRMGTRNRRDALRGVYGFECRCRRCEEPDSDDE